MTGASDSSPTGRAQLSLSAVEGFVGALLIVAATVGFVAAGEPGVAGAEREARLDAHAADAARVLAAPGAGNLTGLTRSRASFDRHRAAARDRLTDALPPNLLFRVETPRGTVGYPPPSGRPLGRATRATIDGPVTVRVWFQ